ncbi:MAG: DNA polymerase II large subunit [Nanoarchaeota archaeon]
MNMKEHFAHIESKSKEGYDVAELARAKGLDPVSRVEVPVATSLAEKSVGLISVVYPQIIGVGIVERIIELEKEFGPLEMAVSLKIAEEIAREKFCKFENVLEAIEAGIRVAFAYTTLGVVSSPIEGFTSLKLGKTKKGEDYFIAYFSGPIRSAGTTAGCVVLMIIDYLREAFGYAKYDPDEDEVRRYVVENYDYHERVTNLQYLPTEEEIDFLARNLPFQIAGEPTENREVSNYKDLPRIETNFIRGGMCLIFSEGLAQKAQKGLRLLKRAQERGFVATGWNFLDQYISLHKKREKGTSDTSPTYIKDLVAGRPVFSHPSRSGGFRFRYGLSRTNGFSATSVSPATMGISDDFISFGTQLKIEKPTKGCAVSSCDKIDGPIVKLYDGSVVRVKDHESAKKLYPEVEEIIYLGDILVSFGDVANRNYDLLKPGYVEEWWNLNLAKNGGKVEDCWNVSFEEALRLSVEFKVPLHPSFIYYWSQIEYQDFLALLDWASHGEFIEGRIVLPFNSTERERFFRGKRALEIIGCPHKVSFEHVVIFGDDARAFLENLGIKGEFKDSFEKVLEKIPKEGNVLEIINLISNFIIKDKAGTFIGARMGRPEKAKLRKLTGSPHALFPVGVEGGRLRSFQAAVEAEGVTSEFPIFWCEKCKDETIYPRCDRCLSVCVKRYYCRDCGLSKEEICTEHNKGDRFSKRVIDIGRYFSSAKQIAGVRLEELPVAIKGIRGSSSKDHSCEHLAKGFLRAKYDLHVNKDGTIRYDMTEMPVGFFKPAEIGTSVEDLRKLGYDKDIDGLILERDEQVLEIFPHDIILPACPISMDEKADDVFLRVSKFIDDELEKIYGLDRYYNAVIKRDLVGSLFVCIAPHICTATVGRLIGFSKTQAMLASPYMHAAMRRDCDGDEAAVMLLMDMLLNFSRSFLPAHRGGTQDAPLVLNTKISAGEVDDQILDLELGKYPLELYELAEQGKHSSEVKIENVKSRLKSGLDPFTGNKFTHDTNDFNRGVISSSYKILPTMQEKVSSMMNLCTKIRAVDVSDVARLVIERHFMRDIRGNLRKFSMQAFRCVDCNESFRRVPLSGKCMKCSGKVIFTITEGSIIKYLASALDLARKYNVSPYLLECLEITEKDIQGIFGKEKEKQMSLQGWFAPQAK